MHRTFVQHGIRTVLLVAIALSSLAFVSGSVVLWAVLGAVLALDGPYRSFGVLFTLTLVTELVGGIGLGTLSLPFASTALLVMVGGRLLLLAPWPVAERWHLGAAVRAWVVASGSGMLMAVLAALMTAVVYGYTADSIVSNIARPQVVAGMIGTTALTLAVFRRIDIPFRVRTEFGT